MVTSKEMQKSTRKQPSCTKCYKQRQEKITTKRAVAAIAGPIDIQEMKPMTQKRWLSEIWEQ